MHIKTSTLRQIFSVIILSVLIVSNISNQALAGNSDFEPPPKKDAPKGGTAGGGSRTNQKKCLEGSLAALSPKNQIGLTQVQRPKFWVNLPNSQAKIGEFSLFDAQMRGIYQTNIPLQQPGLLNLEIPHNAPSLAKNTPYYWAFAVVCNQSDRTEDIVVGGWVEYRDIDLKFQQKLAQSNKIQQVSQNFQQGYWYDALASLIELQKIQSASNPEIAEAWSVMFKVAGINPHTDTGLATVGMNNRN
ncbi:DUF928 domain-containing protein [Calothrix sp. PCC 6303]|uniref:DUF928 domain-containing protein n=1 Tax=Calothrix sp. PCC 6303 TaxID=1170562 RepID=UPI0002A0556B|nr:DUF928 domain-containing protein [Calothrix sp. PCC 6303]AFZ03082.1 protein of unknown function DUF928 [Calothrix sp. PCC 6303]